MCFCGSSCRRAQSGFYLSSAHLQHARLKHPLDSITQQGVLDGVWRSGQAVFSFTPQQQIVVNIIANYWKHCVIVQAELCCFFTLAPNGCILQLLFITKFEMLTLLQQVIKEFPTSDLQSLRLALILEDSQRRLVRVDRVPKQSQTDALPSTGKTVTRVQTLYDTTSRQQTAVIIKVRVTARCNVSKVLFTAVVAQSINSKLFTVLLLRHVHLSS